MLTTSGCMPGNALPMSQSNKIAECEWLVVAFLPNTVSSHGFENYTPGLISELSSGIMESTNLTTIDYIYACTPYVQYFTLPGIQ